MMQRRDRIVKKMLGDVGEAMMAGIREQIWKDNERRFNGAMIEQGYGRWTRRFWE